MDLNEFNCRDICRCSHRNRERKIYSFTHHLDSSTTFGPDNSVVEASDCDLLLLKVHGIIGKLSNLPWPSTKGWYLFLSGLPFMMSALKKQTTKGTKSADFDM